MGDDDSRHLAIDIQLKKLLDWLVSRRICNRQWHDAVVQIREKIGSAIGDMPEHDTIRELLSGTNINYFHCLQIVGILRETEKDSKNFFGSYGSQRMKDWQEVVRLYEREQVYLAEASQLLSQAIAYEIPGLKKLLAKSIATQEDCDKREKENGRKAVEFRAEFDKSCRLLGIEGKRLRREIIALLDELPNTYSKVAEDSKKLERPRRMYVDFLQKSIDDFDDGGQDDVLPMLTFLMERGNVTTYEWTYGEPPLSVEEQALDFGDEEDGGNNEDNKEEGQIDFGDGDIDFSSVDDVEMDSGADIDWGNLDAAGPEEAIDWGAAAGSDSCDVIAGIVVEDGGVSGGVARDSEALSLLDNRKTRTLIIDELIELECFLEQRLAEMQEQDEGRFTVGVSDVMGKGESNEVLSAYISEIRSLTSLLSAGKLHQLQLIRSSPKYVDRLVAGLVKKLDLTERMAVSNRVVAEKRDAAIQDQAVFQKKLDLIKRKTCELQENIEKDISKRYKDRPVNIMGGAQSV